MKARDVLIASMLIGCPASQVATPSPDPPSPAPAAPLAVTIRTTAELETATKTALEAVLRQYDVKRWTFTKDVAIDAWAIPHSHPVLTLHSRYHDEPDRLLLLFVHEQLHWFLEEPRVQSGLAAAKAELAARYPDAPGGLPEGGFNLDSTHLHIVLCWLELEAGRKLLGESRTRAIFEAPHIYNWVYATVLKDDADIAALIDKHGLRLP